MKTVLITGCSRGLGKELYNRFDNSEHNVICHFRKAEQVSKAHTYWVIGDLKNKDTFECILELLNETGLDILINNAGIYDSQLITDNDFKKYKEMIEINLLAPILLTKIAWPFLKKTNGKIFNINSLAGKTGGKNELGYSATKAGLKGFNEALQYDAVKDNISVTNFYIGSMKTKMVEGRNKNNNLLIDPKEVANYIYNYSIFNYSTMRVTDIDIFRRNY